MNVTRVAPRKRETRGVVLGYCGKGQPRLAVGRTRRGNSSGMESSSAWFCSAELGCCWRSRGGSPCLGSWGSRSCGAHGVELSRQSSGVPLDRRPRGLAKLRGLPP